MKSLFHFLSKPSFKAWSLAALSCLPLQGAPVFETQEDLFKHIENKRKFTFDIDQDFNQFPDTFSMEKGRGFQTYHSVRIDHQGYDDGKSLKIVFSGGKAGINSYPIIMDARYAYNLQLHFKGNSLGERFSNKLEFGLKAYDKDNNLLPGMPKMVEKSFSSEWQKSKVLRIERLPENTDTCVLYINLEGRPSGRSELWVDQIEIIPSPRIHFETGKPLNVYDFEDDIQYKVSIDGTNLGEPYILELEITDFMGHSIDKKSFPFNGSLNSQVFKRPLLQSSSGVYNLNARLLYGDKTLLELQEIMARNTPAKDKVPNQAFGVLLGHPQAPFDRLIKSLELLGTQISKLSLLPQDFQISSSENNSDSLPSLDPLLLEKAPDDGYQFIASIDLVPSDTIKDKYNPPKNVLETLANYPELWKKTFDRLIFHYGNVLTDWQLGSDRDALSQADLDKITVITEHLQNKTDWMNILYPSREPIDKQGFTSNFYIDKNMTLSDIKAQLKANPWKKLVATLELHSNEDQSGLFVIEDMVKKISFLMAQRNAEGDPLVERLFIDRLTDEHGAGLMNQNYEPQSSYFAAKTLIHWTYGAEYIGSFQHPDKKIVNFAFKRGNQAFAIFWKEGQSKTTPAAFNLGAELQWMDLMGNKQHVFKDSDGSALLPLSQTPGFLISPYPKLWETMMSFKLTKSPLRSKVELQDQVATIENYFSKQANFEVDFEYPQGWTLQTRKFETELKPKDQAAYQLRLSPSALSPVNTPIPVYAHLDISLKGSKHSVKVYREEKLLSDVQMNMSFFKEGKNLEMVIFVELNSDAAASTSFIASALMPNGQTFEAFFRNVQPGQNNSKRIFVLNGGEMIGKNVNLSVRENIGQRYLNADFPISTSF